MYVIAKLPPATHVEPEGQHMPACKSCSQGPHGSLIEKSLHPAPGMFSGGSLL